MWRTSKPLCQASPRRHAALSLPATPTLPLQLARAFARADKTAADQALADLIFGEGLPIRLVTSPFLRAFIEAVQRLSAPYAPPAYNTMKNTLLQDAKERVIKELQPWEDRLAETGCR